MRRCRRICSGLAALGLALALGCGSGEVRKTYDNQRALQSTVDRPAAGSPSERTYRNSRYRERAFRGVRVTDPIIRAQDWEDRDYREFVTGLREALLAGTSRAIADAKRYGGLVAGPAAGDLVCRVEALPHVTPLGRPVRPDPVFHDPRPKLIVVFTLKDAATREVVLRYTDWGTSQWDYGAWAMEDLRAVGLKLAEGFGEVLKAE